MVRVRLKVWNEWQTERQMQKQDCVTNLSVNRDSLCVRRRVKKPGRLLKSSLSSALFVPELHYFLTNIKLPRLYSYKLYKELIHYYE